MSVVSVSVSVPVYVDKGVRHGGTCLMAVRNVWQHPKAI